MNEMALERDGDSEDDKDVAREGVMCLTCISYLSSGTNLASFVLHPPSTSSLNLITPMDSPLVHFLHSFQRKSKVRLGVRR